MKPGATIKIVRLVLIAAQAIMLAIAIWIEAQGHDYRILYLGADKTTELKATWFLINILCLHLNYKRLTVENYKLINNGVHIIVTIFVAIFNSLIGNKLAHSWKFLTHSRITNMQLSEHFVLQKNWSVQDKIDYSYEIIKKYNDVDPSTVDIILSKVRNNININIEQIPDLVNTLINQYKKINAVQNHGWIHSIKNALYQAFMGDYWYIGWAGVTITTVLSVIYVKNTIGTLRNDDLFLGEQILETNKRLKNTAQNVVKINDDAVITNERIDKLIIKVNDLSQKTENEGNLLNNKINNLTVKIDDLSQNFKENKELIHDVASDTLNVAENLLEFEKRIETVSKGIILIDDKMNINIAEASAITKFMNGEIGKLIEKTDLLEKIIKGLQNT